MEFSEFMVLFEKNAKDMFKNTQNLFLANVDADVLWETYLESFPSEKNKIYRVRREFDCSCCKSFIRHFGHLVSIQDNKIVTLWDFEIDDDTYEPVLRAMSNLLKESVVSDVLVTKNSSFGTPVSHEYLESKLIKSWEHFHLEIPKTFVSTSSLSVNEITSSYRDIRNVFKRSLEEISKDSVQTVLDLIDENSLYRGEEWKSVLLKFLELKTNYNKLKTNKEKENYCWSESMKVGGSVAKIKNHSIGTLLVDISNGLEIDEAVRKYEVIVAPTNYKRPKAIFTAKMVEDAQKTIESLGMKDSLGRRHAHISDITINNVLWANRNAKQAMESSNDVFEMLKNDVAVNPETYEKITGIKINDFLNDLNKVSSLEILFENRHEGNLMSVIAPKVKESPSLFKWNNSFSWSYNGNIADSMKQRVKAAGGKIDGVLRFSLQWNTENDNQNDYDAHCVEPNGNEIYFGNKGRIHSSSGMLDVDIINPVRNVVAVENIVWSNDRRMKPGKYVLFVHNYSHRGGTSGFDAEVEFGGQIYEFSYHKDLKANDKVVVAEVILDERGNMSLGKSLPSSTSTKTIWSLKTNQFVPASVVMYSPNYWDEQDGIGNRHYFFILSGCKNESQPNGFYNEYLKEDMMRHKKVFEALGSKMKVENSDIQLSGLGFSTTKQDYIIAKVDGHITKIIF